MQDDREPSIGHSTHMTIKTYKSNITSENLIYLNDEFDQFKIKDGKLT
jgi:hypothetical protein